MVSAQRVILKQVGDIMPKEKKPKPIITADIKAVLDEKINERGKTQIRIVHWIVDGRDTGAKYEKRSFFKKKDETFSDFGSCKGLNKSDMEFIISNWEEIKLFF